MNRFKPYLRSASLVALMTAAAPLHAQTAEPQPADAQATQSTAAAGDTTSGDIVVTAQKRSERLNDVPISISAATGDQLKAQGVTSTEDLQKIVAGFTFDKTAFGAPVFFLRGVGFNDTTLGVSPAVSIYVDQQPLPFSPMARGAVLDLERVEVLKGPQGTLFGQNSTGGAVNYIAAKPTRDLQAGFDLDFGRFNAINGEAFISGPITSTLKARVAVRNEYQDEWQRGYTTDQRLGNRSFSSGRLLLDWDPVDALSIELSASGWRDRSDTQALQFIAYRPLNPRGRPDQFGFASLQPAPRDPRAAAWDPDVDFRRDDHLYQFGGRAVLELASNLNLTSLTSYAKYKQNVPIDFDASTFGAFLTRSFGDIRSFSQELRLDGAFGDRVKWMVGANYADNRVDEKLLIAPEITTGTLLAGLPFDTVRLDNLQKIKSKSVFGSLDLKLTDQLTLQGSARYTDEDRDFAGCSRDTGDGQAAAAFARLSSALTGAPQTIAPGACFTLSATGAPKDLTFRSLDEDNVSWRGSLNWKPNRDTLLYANITKGYKSGSFPTLPAATETQFVPVKQESVLAYEVGAKATITAGLQVTGAGFYYDYRDKQLLGYQNVQPFGPLPSLVTIPKASVKGGEISVVAQPFRGLTLTANGAYVETEILRDPAIPLGPFNDLGSFKGEAFPYSPKWQGSLDAQYRTRLSEALNGYVGGTVSARSDTFGALLSGVPSAAANEALLRIDGYALLDLRGGVEAADGTWRVELWGRNVTNQFYSIGTTKSSDFANRFTGMPVTYGVALRYRFND
jgi:iron complex outermembrane recepter protein